MGYKLGSTTLNQIKLGATEIKKAYLGSTLFYDKTGAPAPKTMTANVLTASGARTVGLVTTITTPSITVTAGRPVMVIWADDGYGSANPSRTLTGAGQTWVKVIDKVMNGESSQYDRYTVWKSAATTGGSGALTLGNSAGTDNSAYAVIELQPEAGASVSIGTPTEATQLTGATTNSVALGSANYWLAVTCSSGFISGIGWSGTPRAGWTEISDNATDSAEEWFGGVHTQISPIGGDTTASVTLTKTTQIALICFPLTVS